MYLIKHHVFVFKYTNINIFLSVQKFRVCKILKMFLCSPRLHLIKNVKTVIL